MTTAPAATPTTPTTNELIDRARTALQRCGVDPRTLTADAESITASSPLTGEALLDVPASRPADVEAAIQAAHTAYTRTPQFRAAGTLIQHLHHQSV
jgi:aldehyde dehydrogenase (NAD+)